MSGLEVGGLDLRSGFRFMVEVSVRPTCVGLPAAAGSTHRRREQSGRFREQRCGWRCARWVAAYRPPSTGEGAHQSTRDSARVQGYLAHQKVCPRSLELQDAPKHPRQREVNVTVLYVTVLTLTFLYVRHSPKHPRQREGTGVPRS